MKFNSSLLIDKSSSLLHKMFDEKRYLFSYSAIKGGDEIKNDFSHRLKYRYTVTALAGLQKATFFHSLDWDFNFVLEGFIRNNYESITNAGDLGLLLKVLADADHDFQAKTLRKIELYLYDSKRARKLPLQEICWVLWGFLSYSFNRKDDRVLSLAESIFKTIRTEYFCQESLMPFHVQRGFRRRFVSFGAITYFLKVLHKYSQQTGNQIWMQTFKDAVGCIINLQGPNGEWAWFYDAARRSIVDWYQIYSVHQDSMSMLFLLPALNLGVPGCFETITKSYKWLFGFNELNEIMIHRDPFFIKRSLRRNDRFEREKRFIRSMGLSTLGLSAKKEKKHNIEINPECRSYHIGWILYIWSGRFDFPEFTELNLLNSVPSKDCQ